LITHNQRRRDIRPFSGRAQPNGEVVENEEIERENTRFRPKKNSYCSMVIAQLVNRKHLFRVTTFKKVFNPEPGFDSIQIYIFQYLLP